MKCRAVLAFDIVSEEGLAKLRTRFSAALSKSGDFISPQRLGHCPKNVRRQVQNRSL